MQFIALRGLNPALLSSPKAASRRGLPTSCRPLRQKTMATRELGQEPRRCTHTLELAPWRFIWVFPIHPSAASHSEGTASRLSLDKISLAGLVQTNGLGLSLAACEDREEIFDGVEP